VLLGLEETAGDCHLPFMVLPISLMPPLLIVSSNTRAFRDSVVAGAEATRCLGLSSLLMHRFILMHLRIFSSSAVAFRMWGEAHSIHLKKHLLPLKSMNLYTAKLAVPISHSWSRKQDASRRGRQLFNPIKAQ